jgi:hypothetical protein
MKTVQVFRNTPVGVRSRIPSEFSASLDSRIFTVPNVGLVIVALITLPPLDSGNAASCQVIPFTVLLPRFSITLRTRLVILGSHAPSVHQKLLYVKQLSEPQPGDDPGTSSLPRKCSAAELLRRILLQLACFLCTGLNIPSSRCHTCSAVLGVVGVPASRMSELN